MDKGGQIERQTKRARQTDGQSRTDRQIDKGEQMDKWAQVGKMQYYWENAEISEERCDFYFHTDFY